MVTFMLTYDSFRPSHSIQHKLKGWKSSMLQNDRNEMIQILFLFRNKTVLYIMMALSVTTSNRFQKLKMAKIGSNICRIFECVVLLSLHILLPGWMMLVLEFLMSILKLMVIIETAISDSQ